MKTAIIDLDSVIFYAFHPNKVLDDNKEPIKENGKFVYVEKTEEEIKASCDYLMQDILLSSNATSYIGYIKGKNTISDRLVVNADYKANRPTQKPKFWDFTKQCLIDNWGAIEVNNLEVDDAVNITRLKLENSFICAIDGDLLKLEGTHYKWNKKEWITTTKEEANYKFWSDMICGQSGDFIKGLPGKGIKYADKLFEKLNYKTDLEYAELIFSAYLVHYGNVDIAIKEYYKNYMCLYILKEKEGFIIPEIKEFKNDNTKSQSEEETTTRTDTY
jgi:hypothetical protein